MVLGQISAGPTGAGRLSGVLPSQRGQMTRPSLRQMGIRRPRMPRVMRLPMPPQPMMPQMQSSVPSMPASPSSIMMSEERAHGGLLKANLVQMIAFNGIIGCGA